MVRLVMFKLRPYQLNCLRALDVDFAAGYKRLLVQAATGVGKTCMFLAWLKPTMKPGDRALIVAHRDELITQPIEKARAFFPSLAREMGIVKAEQNDASARIVVATVQTLAVPGRLTDVLAHGAFTHLVIDECHHARASTYTDLLTSLYEANPAMLTTGWTATPTRTDLNGLVGPGAFDKMSFRYPVQQAIRDEALCPFSAYAAGIPVSFSGLSETKDGWNDTELGDILNAENVWDVVFDAWAGKIDGLPDSQHRQTIAFTASVAQAYGGAEYFRQHGVAAEAVDGNTPREDRLAILERFKAGKTQMIFNCAVLTEGFDAPSASCCLMVSPTKSPLVWTQKGGRILRRDPNDENKTAVIVDFYPIERTNVFAADALGVPKAVKDAKAKAEEAGVMVGGWSIDRFGRAVSVDTDRVVVRMLDLMSRSRLPWTLSGHMATTALTEDSAACIVLPDSQRLEKAEALRITDRWTPDHERVYEHIRRVRLYNVQKNGYAWTAELVNYYDEPDDAKASVDSWPSDRNLSSRSAWWRNSPASEKQARYLRRLVRNAPDDPTKGEASRLISEALTLQATERAEKAEENRLFQTT